MEGSDDISIGNKVAEEHPLKQGLKLQHPQTYLLVITVAEEHPLKQGLKQLK